MNILVTAIGSFSGEAVVSSLKSINVGKIVGCDIYPFDWIAISPHFDTFYQVPIVYNQDEYMKSILKIIEEEKINLIIPLTDPEVDFYSRNLQFFENINTTICISNEKAIALCRNKLAFFDYFKNDEKVRLIPTFDIQYLRENAPEFPLIAKPKNGRSSEGIIVFENIKEFAAKDDKLHNHIMQPLLKGDVYTVDVIRNDYTGKVFAIPRKELLRTKNGAGVSVEVSENKELENLSCHIAERIDARGCINIEFLCKDSCFYLMDINPRFSAGVSFSKAVGYDMILNHLNCFTGKDIQDPIHYEKMLIARKQTDIITKKG